MKKSKKVLLFIFNSFDLGGVQKKLVDIAQYKKKSKKFDSIIIHFGFFSDLEEDFPHHTLLEGSDVRTHYFTPKNLRGKRRQLLPLLTWINFTKLILQLKPNVIVVFLHYVLPPIVAIKKLLFFVKTKLVISQDNIASLENKRPFVYKPVPNWLITFLYNQADLIITQTKFAKEDLMRVFSIKEHLIKIIPNWVPDWRFTFNERSFAINERSIDVLYSGRFSEQKNIPLLLDILKTLSSKKISFQAALIGSGDKKTLHRIIHILREKKITKNVSLLHPSLDMKSIMSRSKVLVLTSKFEGMPLVVLEAMLVGTIPVVIDYPAASEYIHHGKTGFICLTKREMVKTIYSILDEPSKYDNFRKQMTKSVKKEFPTSLIEKTLTTLFE